MVEANIDPVSGNGSIVLKPNNSATWRFNLIFIASLALVALCIAFAFLLHGLWLVLPFSGLEISLLYFGLCYCVRANGTTEVITFHNNEVIIEKGRYQAEHKWEYQRNWSKIYIRAPEYHGYPKRVIIRSHGKDLELGAFLNNSDREILISQLKNAVYFFSGVNAVNSN